MSVDDLTSRTQPLVTTPLRNRPLLVFRRAGTLAAPFAPLLRALIWLTAFGLGYRAQMRLEDQAGGYRALVEFIIAAALLGVATLPWPAPAASEAPAST